MTQKHTPHAPLVTLTDEQQRIVHHGYGPALVFAVAGAGKTTTMVRRIERLVREGVFLPERMLAASFSRATVADLKLALKAFPHASKVNVKTLHGLAYGIIQDAGRAGVGPNLKLPEDIDAIPHAILNRALGAARAKGASFAADLESLDREDFFAYLGGCKATLAFVDLEARTLPPDTPASQAEAPSPLRWYLGLYELFEQERLTMGVLTFDDLIPEAWALLVKHPHLAASYQERYDAVMVDEFQDTNLSQVALLDILVARHRNYLVCGDDDQGIFGFRKASNTFILTFAKRYKATRYLISDNFRCFAEHTILANHVISRNKHRVPKQLSPSRGFGGETVLTTHATSEAMGADIARNIREAIDAGRSPKDIAVLVRLYAETGVIENGLINEGVPYRIVGNVPFYDRPENKLLLKYLRLALLDRQLEQGGLTSSIKAQLSELWWEVVRTPRRYVRRETSDALLREVLTRGTPPSVALLTAGGKSRYAGPKLVELGQTIAWLGERLASSSSAHQVLQELERKLAYTQFLMDNSGFAETGQGRAQTVMAFVDYAKGKGDTEAFLSHLERISFGQAGVEKTASSRVTLSSVFRAKGLEWPHVIVPAINYGHYPAAGGNTDLSEERRLFYVALTRSKGRLDLHVVKGRPPSIFMEGLAELLDNANKTAVAFKKHVLEWVAKDALAVVRVYQHLEGYLKRWSGLEESERILIAQWLLAANKAYSLASRAPLPRELERSLLEVTEPDEEKLSLCVKELGVQARLPKGQAPAPSSRRYDVQRDGMLARDTRVRHALHGDGKIIGFGVERGLEFVEIAFTGRNVKLPLKHAAFDVLS